MREAGYDVSLALFGSLRLVRNPSDSCPRFFGDQFWIEERFQTSWNDKIKKDSITISGKRTSQNDVLETNTMPYLFFI
jgi:hypothetical protein